MVILTEKSKIKSIARRVRSFHILGVWIPDYNDRPAREWRRQGERYTDCNIVEVDRYDGGSSWP